jgi:hypothetical protein
MVLTQHHKHFFSLFPQKYINQYSVQYFVRTCTGVQVKGNFYLHTEHLSHFKGPTFQVNFHFHGLTYSILFMKNWVTYICNTEIKFTRPLCVNGMTSKLNSFANYMYYIFLEKSKIITFSAMSPLFHVMAVVNTYHTCISRLA